MESVGRMCTLTIEIAPKGNKKESKATRPSEITENLKLIIVARKESFTINKIPPAVEFGIKECQIRWEWCKRRASSQTSGGAP